MDSATPVSGAELIAQLNDLLALDHDAIEAYSLAIGRVSRAEYREALAGFRGDHQRPAAGAIISRAADDEDQHYAWGEQTLAQLGLREGTIAHTAQETVEKVHGRVADLVEGAGQRVSGVVDRMRSSGDR